ncbi:MAG: Rid family detoxifying hydrolase, partial [Bacteroidales bacterium]|nr:Rid family detoxifying hydrolase [Bacteroidales bacterium]
QLPIDPATGEFAKGGFKEQLTQVFTNLKNVLEEGGFKMSDAVKVTVYLQDLANFAALNEVYARFFSEPYPARVAFQVAALPKNAMVEVDIIAVK